MRPLVRLDEAKERLEHGALAGAVRSKEADGSALEARADVLERLVLAVDDGDVLEHDGWLGRGRGGPWSVDRSNS